MKKLSPIILIVLFTLIACNNPLSGIFQTPTPTNTVYKSPTPTATKTKLILKTSSPVATYTPRNTITPEPTVPPATVAAMATIDTIGLNFPDVLPFSGNLSPNGKWAAFETYINNEPGLKLINVYNNNYWDIGYYEAFGYQHDSYGGYIIVSRWSNDGASVYLEPHPEWDGPNLFFGSAATLVRFNLNNGQWQDLDVGNSFSISPNEKYLVYKSDGNVHAKLLRTGSEEIFPIPQKFEYFGKFVWSPDNEKIVFPAAYGEWYDGKTGFSILLIDLKKSTVEILLEDDFRLLYPEVWLEDTRILLNQHGQAAKYYFDPETKQLLLAP